MIDDDKLDTTANVSCLNASTNCPNQAELCDNINNDKNNTPTTTTTSDNQKICKHFCEKKKRQCKFIAIKNSDFCVEHIAFNNQEETCEKRVVCPIDPKHSVYEKNLQKHLLKCNSRIRQLGDFDVKDVNLLDGDDLTAECVPFKLTTGEQEQHQQLTTYKDLNDEQLKSIIDFLYRLDDQFNLYKLDFNKRENDFINRELEAKNEAHKKHMRQISSIVGHVNVLLDNVEESSSSEVSVIELGAGRGRLSYWFKESRKQSNRPIKENILLVERGSQRLKFDTMIKKTCDETNSGRVERVRIDLKDLFVNRLPMVDKSDRFIMYGKHLCGAATDFSLRCMRRSLEDAGEFDKMGRFKFAGFVLAVCCHHQCEWDYLCGKEFLQSLGIDSKLFYIIRSISSWYTSGDKYIPQLKENVIGDDRERIGRICKNLIDYARIQYLTSKVKLPTEEYRLRTKHFYYVETDVTLENSMIYAYLEKV